jgi:hypothetical protein
MNQQQSIEIKILFDSNSYHPTHVTSNQSPVICLLDSEAPVSRSASFSSSSSDDNSSQYSSTPRWVGDFETGGWVDEVTIDDTSDDDR